MMELMLADLTVLKMDVYLVDQWVKSMVSY